MGGYVLAANAALSLVGVLLLVWHMNEHWSRIGDQGHQLWCMVLFGYAVLVAGASLENAVQGVELELHHLGSTTMSVLLIGAVAFAIRRDRKAAAEDD